MHICPIGFIYYFSLSPIKILIEFIVGILSSLDLLLIIFRVTLLTTFLLLSVPATFERCLELAFLLLKELLLSLKLGIILILAIAHHLVDFAPHPVNFGHEFVLFITELRRLCLKFFNV